MWDDRSEPGAGKSSEKGVKRREMSKDFQLTLWVLEVTYHFNARAVNIMSYQFYNLRFCNFYVLLAAILKQEKQ